MFDILNGWRRLDRFVINIHPHGTIEDVECTIEFHCKCHSSLIRIYGDEKYSKAALDSFMEAHEGHNFTITEYPDRKEDK